MIDEDEQGASLRAEALGRFGEELGEVTGYVCENPRAGRKDSSGRTVVPLLPYGAVLDWLAQATESARVVFVDPISQIEFDGREQWREEADFTRKALALAADTQATICLVAHTVKRPGRAASVPLTLEDVQGSAMIGRLCHCALLLDAHDPKTSEVHRWGGLREEVQHNRTVIIAKARNASGSRQRLAFQQDDQAPLFEELGVIAPKRKE